MNRRLYQQTHATWVCDYHIVWCPKYRGAVLKDAYIKQELKRMFKYIAQWKELHIHFVSTIGSNEHQIKNYINNQRHHQMDLPTFEEFDGALFGILA